MGLIGGQGTQCFQERDAEGVFYFLENLTKLDGLCMTFWMFWCLSWRIPMGSGGAFTNCVFAMFLCVGLAIFLADMAPRLNVSKKEMRKVCFISLRI